MIKDESITILLPVYNEEDNIVNMVEQLDSILKEVFQNYEVLVVESGSTDNTAEVLTNLQKEYKNLRVINEGAKNGYGSGIITGLKACTSDIVFYLDSDIPFDLNIIKKVFPIDKKVDVLIGYRHAHPNLKRAFFSWGFNVLVKYWFKIKVKDVNFSFKILRKRVYQDLKLISKGWFIDAEILSRVTKKRFKIKEIPIKYTPREQGASNVNISYGLIKRMVGELWEYHKDEKADHKR